MVFSVIIPAYNAEAYLSEAIDSVLTQENASFELIIVNDGSTDGTADICKKYAELDSRVVVVCKNNEGVSAARNDGVKKSDGKYVIFLDADDKIAANCLSCLQAKLENLDYEPDIIFASYERFDEYTFEKQVHTHHFSSDLSDIKGLDIWEELYGYDPIFFAPIMAQVYRKSFLIDNSIFFDTQLAISEDHDWRYASLLKSERYFYVPFLTYHYRTSNMSSVMHQKMTLKKYKNTFDFLCKWYDISLGNHLPESVKRIIEKIISRDYANNAIVIHNITDKKEKQQAIELFKSCAYILNSANGFKYKATTLFYKLFGASAYIKLVYSLHSIKQRITAQI